MRLPGERKSTNRSALLFLEGDCETHVADKPGPPDIERLFERFGDAVLNYCYYRLGTWEDAEDAAQQVFISAFAGAGQFRGRDEDPDSTIRCWLFTIARHEVSNRRRTFARRQEARLESAHEVRDPSPSPEELAVAADHQGRVLGLISQLSPNHRQTIELRLAGLTDREIARVLGRSPGAIRVTQFRAISRLRALHGVDRRGKGGSDV